MKRKKESDKSITPETTVNFDGLVERLRLLIAGRERRSGSGHDQVRTLGDGTAYRQFEGRGDAHNTAHASAASANGLSEFEALDASIFAICLFYQAFLNCTQRVTN